MRLARTAAIVVALVAAGSCGSPGAVSTSASSTPTLAPVSGLRSGPAELAPTTNPLTATTVRVPKPTTTPTTTSTTAPPRTIAPPPVAAVFESVIGALAAETAVPIRLPVIFPNATGTVLRAIVAGADVDEYSVRVERNESCEDDCTVAHFSAGPDDPDSPAGVPLALPGGITAEYLDPVCDGDCTDPALRWSEGSTTYRIDLVEGTGSELLALAWSSVDAETRPPDPPVACAAGEPDAGNIIAETVTIEGTSWLVLCSRDGVAVELVREAGRVAWRDVDDDRDLEILVTGDRSGTVELFGLSFTRPVPVVDLDEGRRPRLVDPRCGDVDGDGRMDLVDGGTGDVLRFVTRTTVRRVDTVDAAAVPRCLDR